MIPLSFRAGIVFLILWVIVLGCASQKAEQIPPDVQEKCEAPKWNIGDTWVYEGTQMERTQETVLKVEDESYMVRLSDRMGTVEVRYKSDNLEAKWYKTDGGAAGYISHKYPYKFPLYVGKQWHYWFGDALHLVKVLSVGSVSTPAGIFKAFKIESKWVGSGFHDIYHHWYSPEVKNLVAIHRRYHLRIGPQVETLMELVSYKPADK
ncbi:MAG: hypothetical protein EHM36_14415 [Deltaproteobacteria bacterium]|nr:MAG: hypothetical protein EHM36_14415 [Deltaproteobacteria bacterium]